LGKNLGHKLKGTQKFYLMAFSPIAKCMPCVKISWIRS